MHAATMLLEEAFKLAQLEDAALDAEDVDRAEELSVQRSNLLRQAWDERGDCDPALLREQLVKMSSAHDALMNKAIGLQGRLRSQMAAGQKQTKYFDGDRYIYAQARKSMFCDKVS